MWNAFFGFKCNFYIFSKIVLEFSRETLQIGCVCVYTLIYTYIYISLIKYIIRNWLIDYGDWQVPKYAEQAGDTGKLMV